MYFAGYLRKNKIEGIYYLTKETNQLIKMPFINFEINHIQKVMLKEIEKIPLKIEGFKNRIGKSKSVFYKYLKDLEQNGYLLIEDGYAKITDTGRIILL